MGTVTIERDNMVKRDILRCASHSTEIACPVVTLNNSLAVNLLNSRGVHLASTATALNFSMLLRVFLSPNLKVPLSQYIPRVTNLRRLFAVANSIIGKIPLTVVSAVLTGTLRTMLLVSSTPTSPPRTCSIRILTSTVAGLFTILFWISVIVCLPNRLVTVLTLSMQTSGSVCVELTRSFFSMAIGTPHDSDTCFIHKRPVETSSRVIAVLLSTLRLMNSLFTSLAPCMEVACTVRSKLTDRLDFQTVFASLCFGFLLRGIQSTLCIPLFARF